MAEERPNTGGGQDPDSASASRMALPLGQTTSITASKEQLERWNIETAPDKPGAYIVELNLMHRGPVNKAEQRFLTLYGAVVKDPKRQPFKISQTYFSCQISMLEQKVLVRVDKAKGPREASIFRIWPDFEVEGHIDRSAATVKADAARRSYAASGRNITWAVIDSGINADHPHFAHYNNLLNDDVNELHMNFTIPNQQTTEGALTDEFGHGTHVAGIIAGGLVAPTGEDKETKEVPHIVLEKIIESDSEGQATSTNYEQRDVEDRTLLSGVAPACKLVSLKVLDSKGKGRASNVMRALHYIREQVNADPKVLRIHGVNISAGYEFNANVFACGQSPLCVEVNRLVRAGVVVVVASGNTGYGEILTDTRPGAKAGLTDTINDPGNAELAITVGATHRFMPHTYGVSFFSSKGPTSDGRLKPDLVAPGERITSCASGSWLDQIKTQLHEQAAENNSFAALSDELELPTDVVSEGGDASATIAELPDPAAVYTDYSGTSMAAPHVSGAVAAFLSIRQEFIQRPDDVKRIFLDSATSLGRERYFEGHGLVDLMRAIQSV